MQFLGMKCGSEGVTDVGVTRRSYWSACWRRDLGVHTVNISYLLSKLLGNLGRCFFFHFIPSLLVRECHYIGQLPFFSYKERSVPFLVTVFLTTNKIELLSAYYCYFYLIFLLSCSVSFSCWALGTLYLLWVSVTCWGMCYTLRFLYFWLYFYYFNFGQ